MVSPVEFCRDIWFQKTRVTELLEYEKFDDSLGVCQKLRQTDVQKDGIATAFTAFCIASCGKEISVRVV